MEKVDESRRITIKEFEALLPGYVVIDQVHYDQGFLGEHDTIGDPDENYVSLEDGKKLFFKKLREQGKDKYQAFMNSKPVVTDKDIAELEKRTLDILASNKSKRHSPTVHEYKQAFPDHIIADQGEIGWLDSQDIVYDANSNRIGLTDALSSYLDKVTEGLSKKDAQNKLSEFFNSEPDFGPAKDMYVAGSSDNDSSESYTRRYIVDNLPLSHWPRTTIKRLKAAAARRPDLDIDIVVFNDGILSKGFYVDVSGDSKKDVDKWIEWAQRFVRGDNIY